MCVCVCLILSVSFLWVQVPGTGPKARKLEESEADIVLGGEEDLWCWKGLQKMKGRGSCGGNERANRVGRIWGGGWELGGRGAPRENESIPGDCAWEGRSEDAHDCFKVLLYMVNESGNGLHQPPKSSPSLFARIVQTVALCWKSTSFVFLKKKFIHRKTRQTVVHACYDLSPYWESPASFTHLRLQTFLMWLNHPTAC